MSASSTAFSSPIRRTGYASSRTRSWMRRMPRWSRSKSAAASCGPLCGARYWTKTTERRWSAGSGPARDHGGGFSLDATVRIVAFITEASTVQRILDHNGESAAPRLTLLDAQRRLDQRLGTVDIPAWAVGFPILENRPNLMVVASRTKEKCGRNGSISPVSC
jgi:hypothetical protein